MQKGKQSCFSSACPSGPKNERIRYLPGLNKKNISGDCLSSSRNAIRKYSKLGLLQRKETFQPTALEVWRHDTKHGFWLDGPSVYTPSWWMVYMKCVQAGWVWTRLQSNNKRIRTNRETYWQFVVVDISPFWGLSLMLHLRKVLPYLSTITVYWGLSTCWTPGDTPQLCPDQISSLHKDLKNFLPSQRHLTRKLNKWLAVSSKTWIKLSNFSEAFFMCTLTITPKHKLVQFVQKNNVKIHSYINEQSSYLECITCLLLPLGILPFFHCVLVCCVELLSLGGLSFSEGKWVGVREKEGGGRAGRSGWRKTVVGMSCMREESMLN